MASLQKLLQQLPGVHAEFFAACRAAEDARGHEDKAATVIQKYARGFLTRRRLDNLSLRVITIQRAWRGYLGRQKALQAREARDKRLREAYFASKAVNIQRHWRGFWSRTYVFDFYARKVYLARVAQLNAKMRELLAEEGERAAHTQRALAQEAARTAFNEKISKLHHLLSTQSQPGIFASPYALAAGTIPIIAGAPVEEHLKAAFHVARKNGPATAKSASPESTGSTFLPPIKSQGATAAADAAPSPGSTRAVGRAGHGATGAVYPGEVFMAGLNKTVPRNLTLRQAVPYDVVRTAEVLEAKVVKAEMMTRHPVPFAASLRKPEQPALTVQTNSNLEPYHDPCDPTIGVRSETFTAAQQAMSPKRFAKYHSHQAYFDQALLHQADSLPPKSYHKSPPPAHAAGFTSADARRRAMKPAR